MADEHDDDLDSEVIEGEEIETDQFEQVEDDQEVAPATGATDVSRYTEEGTLPVGSNDEDEERDDESSDTI